MVNVRTKNFHLRNTDNQWIAQVVITSDWMFSCISEYWNFSFAWRSTWVDDFRKFLLKIDESYFWWKMYQGISYIANTKKVENNCYRFADKVLPILKETLKGDIEKNPVF